MNLNHFCNRNYELFIVFINCLSYYVKYIYIYWKINKLMYDNFSDTISRNP